MSEGAAAAHDVLLVGGGGAGLRAAIAIAESNPSLSVAVVSKVYPMRSHTVSAEGGAAGAIAEDDTLDEHAYDTVSGSDWLCDQDAVEAFVQEAPRELLQLEHWGCPWSRQPDGRIAVRAFGGMKNRRTWFAADKTGFHMLHTLFQTSLKYADLTRYDEWFVSRLLVDDGRVHGVVAIELRTGRIEAITAKSVVLCNGGSGKVFPFTTNAAICTGDGMALAYRAGAPLKDMEFVQYHPTGLPFTGILITEATRAEGGWLLNKDGYRYLQDYDLGTPEPTPVLRSMELGPRDRLSQAFVTGSREGPDDRVAVRADSSSRPAAPGREADRHQAPYGARAVFELRAHRSRQGADPRPPGGALHDGRRTHRHRWRDAHRGALRGWGDRLRDHQRGEPAGLQLAAGVPGLRRPSRQGRCGVRRSAKPPPPVVMRQAEDEVRRMDQMRIPRQWSRADRRHPRRDAVDHGGQCRDLPLRRLAEPRASTSWLSCSSDSSVSSSTTRPRCSTPSWSLLWSWQTCSTSPRPSCSPLCNAKNLAAPISAPTSPHATTRASSTTRWPIVTRTVPSGSSGRR